MQTQRVETGGYVDEEVLDVARSIRPYLAALAGERAGEIDTTLRGLLQRASRGDDVEIQILDVLGSIPTVHNWAAGMLADEDGLPPQLQATRAADFAGLPGLGEPVDLVRFVCPVDRAYAWWQTFVGDQVPSCPDHPGTELIRG
jgi:hypothetical protein